MAMYFFDVDGDGAYDDSLGVDLDGIDAAKQEAVKACGEYIKDLEPGSSVLNGSWSVIVRDAAREEVFRLVVAMTLRTSLSTL